VSNIYDISERDYRLLHPKLWVARWRWQNSQYFW